MISVWGMHLGRQWGIRKKCPSPAMMGAMEGAHRLELPL